MPDLRKSVCALDCPDTCALLVKVDETGRGVKLMGDPTHPITRGFLCGKVARYLEREYHPHRLLHPLRRVGAKGEGRFERITWDQALDGIAERLAAIAAEHGSEAVLPYSYAGTMGLLNGSAMDRRFFHRLGASRLDRTICSSTGGVALTRSQGARWGLDTEQFSQAKLIIAWGANVLGTNIHLWPFIVEARRQGAKFYVIDPVKNRTGAAADRHFAIRPGTDTTLALALAHVILRDALEDCDYISRHADGFDEFASLARKHTPEYAARITGIPAADIENLAREYASTQPAAIRLNYGVQRGQFGGAAVRAIVALPVLTGAWKYAGGGAQLTTSGVFQFNTAALERPDLQMKSLGREARLLNMVRLGEALTATDDPPVKALVVYNSNPAAVAPHQTRVLEGLRRHDLFTVVLEQMQTDTADYADIVLPVTTFLEHTDLYRAYGHYYVQLARPALAPAGEAKSNVEIFRLLAKRMGFEDACFNDSEDEMIRQALDTESPLLNDITVERLERERSVRVNIGERFLPFAEGFGGDGKFHFGGEDLDAPPPVESRFGDPELLKRYPLEFVSPKSDVGMNSTLGHRDDADEQTSRVVVHPEDAAARGIATGTLVRIFNSRGEHYAEAVVAASVVQGAVAIRSTRWNKLAHRGLGVNRLTSEQLTDMGNGPAFYSCLVEVERAEIA